MKKSTENSRSISSIIKGSMSNIVIGAFIFLALVSLIGEFVSVTKVVENALETETTVAAERIEWAITSYKNIAEDIGTIPELSDPSVSVQRKEEILENKSEEYGLIRCKIVNPDGKSDMDAEYRGDRAYFKKAMEGETCIVDPVVAKTDGNLTVIVAAPVWENGVYGSEVKGVVFCSIQPELLSRIVSDVEMSNNTSAYVLGATGTIVASTNLSDVSNHINHIEKAKNDQYYSKIAAVDSAALRGKDGVLISWDGVLGGRIYGMHALDGTPDWHLVIHSPLMDYLRPLWIAFGIYIIVVIGLIILLNRRSVAVANKIGDPFKEIADRLKRAAEGDLSTEVLTFGDTDEIKIISNAARDLVNRLDYMTTENSEFDSTVSLKNLIGETTLRSVQDMIMSTTGFANIILDADGSPITPPTDVTRFCDELKRESLLGRQMCEACDRKGAMDCIAKEQCITYFCHAGLKECAVPIMMEGRYIGAILGGQIRVDEVDEEKTRVLCEKYDIDADKYIEALNEIKIWSQEEMDRIESVLNASAVLLSDMARQAYRQNIKNRKQEKRAILRNVKSSSADTGIASIVKNISGINALDMFKPDASNVAKNLFGDSSEKLFESAYNPRSVVENAIGDMELRTKGRQVDFLLDIKDTLPTYLMGDEDKVSNITNRMVQTAISATDAGYIRMDVSSVRSGYVTYLKLKIRYSGGNEDAIDTERMCRFFDRRHTFSLENHNAQEIGLITLSNVISEVNGKVEIRDNKGQGVTICVVIPQLEATEEI